MLTVQYRRIAEQFGSARAVARVSERRHCARDERAKRVSRLGRCVAVVPSGGPGVLVNEGSGVERHVVRNEVRATMQAGAKRHVSVASRLADRKGEARSRPFESSERALFERARRVRISRSATASVPRAFSPVQPCCLLRCLFLPRPNKQIRQFHSRTDVPGVGPGSREQTGSVNRRRFPATRTPGSGVRPASSRLGPARPRVRPRRGRAVDRQCRRQSSRRYARLRW